MSKKSLAIIMVFMLAGVPLIAAHTANNSTNHTHNETNVTEEEGALTPNTTNDTVANESVDMNETNESVTDLTEEENATEENVTNVTEAENATELNVTANVSTIIITSTENYPDAFIAATAASKIGAPVLLTENETLSSDTRDALSALNPDEVVLVGGPQVIERNVSDPLREDYNVTRLWGFTRYGTSVEVAEYFWPEGSETAVIAQSERRDTEYRPLAAASQLAQEDGEPLYLTPEDAVPAITVSSLENLGVERATVIGTNISDEYISQLDEVDVSVEEEITAENQDELLDRLQNRTSQQLADAENLVIVASESFGQALVAVNTPNTATLHVTSEQELQGLMNRLNETDLENATVVGSEELGQTVASRMEEAGYSVTTLLGGVGDATALNRQFVLRHAEAFEQATQNYLEEREQVFEENQDRIRERVAALIIQTERLMDEDTPEEANESLERAAMLFQDGEYAAALQVTMRTRNLVRLHQFEETVGTAAFEAEVAAEMRTLEQFRRQVRQASQEFGDAFDTAPLSTQLWIVETVRNVPQEEEDLIFQETASTLEEEEELLIQFEDARERVQSGNLTVNRTGNQTGTNVTNQTNVTTTTNITNQTTNQTNGTNVSATNDTNETFEENESTNVVTIAGQRFNSSTRCLSGNNTTENVSAHAIDNVIQVNGSVVLPTPNFNATSNVSIDEDQNRADVHVNFTERDGVGLQCLGQGTFTQEFNVSDGEWTVDVAVHVRNETVTEEEFEVQVPPEQDENQTNESMNESDEVNMTTIQEDNESPGTMEAQEVSMVDNSFQPADIEVDQGNTLVFVNNGDTVHNINIPGLGIDEDVQPGEEISVQMDETGTFDLVCQFHDPEMTGTITVS